jgi:hypothetical protein
VYIVYIRERYSFSLVCTFQKAIENVEVKINVQKMSLRVRGKFGNRCASSIQFTYSCIVII